MEGNSDIFQAICCLTVEKRFGYMRQTSELLQLVYIQNTSVRISLTSDSAVVDLGFESSEDYDYLQTLELCREFTAMADARELEEKTNSDLSLVLFINPKGESDFCLMGEDAAWSFIPEKSGEMCRAIQFIFVKEKFKIYKPEEAVK